MKKIIESKWMQELLILSFSFVLFTMGDWIMIIGWKSFFMGFFYFLILYGHAQFNRFFLLPILNRRLQPVVYFIGSVTALLFFSFLLHQLTDTALYKTCFLFAQNPQKKTYSYQVGILLASSICILGMTQLLVYYREQKIRSNKEVLSNQSEIDFLKKQLNPHFLFNTLNTVYGISLQFPNKTPELIMKLSQLLRYQLEITKKEYVYLEQEIDFINSFIELEKERVGYRCDIQFICDIDNKSKYMISPMILFNFVENAFKHGTSNIEHTKIYIELTVKNNVLNFKSINSISNKVNKESSTQIGLVNTKARLEMLYPKVYTLDIKFDELMYNVHLKMSI